MSEQPPPPDPDAPLSGAARNINEAGLVAIIWVCFSIATIFVGLRLLVRWRQNRALLADDFWIMFAWLCITTMAILQTEQLSALWYTTYLSAGRISPADPDLVYHMKQLTRWQFPVIKLFWTVLWSVKASFLSVFYRLVHPVRWTRYAWYGVATFTAIAYIGCVLASTLTCTHPADYFEPGHCDTPIELWRQRFNVIYSTTVDITSDVFIMLLPIAVLPQLQLDKRKKVGLGVAFSLGFIIIGVAIVRMTQVIVKAKVDLVGLAIWGAVETATAIVVGSLFPLKAFLARRVEQYHSNKVTQRYGANSSASALRAAGTFGTTSASKNIRVAESIPLDDVHHSHQDKGRIYVQKTYETRISENDDNSSQEWEGAPRFER